VVLRVGKHDSRRGAGQLVGPRARKWQQRCLPRLLLLLLATTTDSLFLHTSHQAPHRTTIVSGYHEGGGCHAACATDPDRGSCSMT
jgi:hypothetical protein